MPIPIIPFTTVAVGGCMEGRVEGDIIRTSIIKEVYVTESGEVRVVTCNSCYVLMS